MGQQFRSIGGHGAVTPQMLADCYGRMSGWVELARQTLEVEWPTFEALRAFGVFQLKPRLAPAVIKKDLAKISKIFDEVPDAPALFRSFTDCEYTAAKRRVLIVIDIFCFHLTLTVLQYSVSVLNLELVSDQSVT